MPPPLSFLLEHLHSPTARFPPLFATFALVTLAESQEIIRVVAPHVGHRFKSLVAALECEVDRSILEVAEFVVVLHDQGLVATAHLFACLDQQIVPLLGG